MPDPEFRAVKSPRGITPRGAYGTVLEPLGSHGSYHPAVRGLTPAFHKAKSSVSRSEVFASHRCCLASTAFEPLEFPCRPMDQHPIQISEHTFTL